MYMNMINRRVDVGKERTNVCPCCINLGLDFIDVLIFVYLFVIHNLTVNNCILIIKVVSYGENVGKTLH